jgi:hypothetical protein
LARGKPASIGWGRYPCWYELLTDMNSTRLLLRGFSKVLLGSGSLIFFFGDRALSEFWHVNFGLAEIGGIGGGVLLVILGALLQSASSKQKNSPEVTGSVPE